MNFVFEGVFGFAPNIVFANFGNFIFARLSSFNGRATSKRSSPFRLKPPSNMGTLSQVHPYMANLQHTNEVERGSRTACQNYSVAVLVGKE